MLAQRCGGWPARARPRSAGRFWTAV